MISWRARSLVMSIRATCALRVARASRTHLLHFGLARAKNGGNAVLDRSIGAQWSTAGVDWKCLQHKERNEVVR